MSQNWRALLLCQLAPTFATPYEKTWSRHWLFGVASSKVFLIHGYLGFLDLAIDLSSFGLKTGSVTPMT
jgi:hypothetical protein